MRGGWKVHSLEKGTRDGKVVDVVCRTNCGGLEEYVNLEKGRWINGFVRVGNED